MSTPPRSNPLPPGVVEPAKPSNTASHRQSGKVLPLFIIAVVALIAGLVVSGQFGKSTDSDSPTTSSGVKAAQATELAALQETLKTSLALPLDFKSVPDFELLDANAQPITQSVFDDEWSVVFFGFTHCPDVCPVTLQVMKEVVNNLAEVKSPTLPQVIFVSIDPARDTSEVMKKYISYFNDSFIGITGDLNSVHKMTSALGIVASFTANDSDPENYGVDHTASMLLIDPQRRVRAKISPPHEADTITADYLSIIAAPS